MYLTNNTLPFSTKKLAESIETAGLKYVISPYSYDARFYIDLKQRSQIKQGWLNNPYAGWLMALYSLRDHANQLFNLVKGQMIDEKEFMHKKHIYNEFMIKVEKQIEKYEKTNVTLNDILNMASIWILLTRSADLLVPMKSDGKKTLVTHNDSTVFIHNIRKEFEHLSKILEKTSLCDLEAESFVNRVLLTEEQNFKAQDTLWAFLPGLEDVQECTDLIDLHVPQLIREKVPVVFAYPKSKEKELHLRFGLLPSVGKNTEELYNLRVLDVLSSEYYLVTNK
jgi:hypothetical protein